MLERYRYDQRISLISGDNFDFGYRVNHDSYYFSRNSHIWGWASWRDRWTRDYDVELKSWPALKSEGTIKDLFYSEKDQIQWTRIFDRLHLGEIDTWDYQLRYAMLVNGRLSIIPNVNLISNIGFGPEATHTISDGATANLPTEPILFPLKHPIGIYANNQLDERYANMVRKSVPSLMRRAFSKIRRIM
jgi:hypothetical protein